MTLAAVFFDLGDVVMDEMTEEKIDGVTQRAELVPGMAQLLHDLHAAGQHLALVADTRQGTYRNVLRQHGLFDLFDAFAISDELGAEKPDTGMFEYALNRLAVPTDEWGRVAMVGNNLARDIKGANAIGLISIWFAWNERYPSVPTDASERPVYQVSDARELDSLLATLGADLAPPEFPVASFNVVAGRGKPARI